MQFERATTCRSTHRPLKESNQLVHDACERLGRIAVAESTPECRPLCLLPAVIREGRREAGRQVRRDQSAASRERGGNRADQRHAVEVEPATEVVEIVVVLEARVEHPELYDRFE